MKKLFSLLCLLGILFAFQAKLNAGDTYLVIYDMDKTEWKYRYTDDPPDLTKDTCRTTELWLRQIPAGSFTMGSPEDELGRYSDETQVSVIIKKMFYIGVFECTQRQWELVMGSNPSSETGDCRPVDCVSYDMIRGTGATAGAGWPTYGHAVDAASFMGVLRAKTGLAFDLPTSAQWEYACRAGTETALNSGENLNDPEGKDANMDEVGRYRYNQDDGKGDYDSFYTTVGSYRPNAWGLYDMHGNVFEWCLDWWDIESSYSTSPLSDPVGNATGETRMVRGGGAYNPAYDCRSAAWGIYGPSKCGFTIGFRVLCLSPEKDMVTVVRGTTDKTSAAEGETVTVWADTPPLGEMFDRWTSDDVAFENPTAPVTTFNMSGKAVTVTATFKKTTAQTYLVIYDMDKADWKYRFTDDPPNLPGR